MDLKKICKTLGAISFVVGAIGSIVLAVTAGVTLSISRHGNLDKVRNWPLTIIYFIACLLCTAIFSFILLGISEVLERLETITKVQNTLVQNTTPDTKDDPPQDYWKCPQCGKSNPPYTGTCSCGNSKS